MNTKSDDIAESAIKGIFWIGSGQVIKQVVGILTYVMLVRLLTSDDFGVMSMALVFVGFSMLFVEFGIGTAIVHRQDISDTALSSAFWINLGAATSLATILAATSPLIAWLYHKPELTPFLIALAFTLLLAGLQVIPKALLQRKLHFYPIARAEALASTVAAACTVILAWRGFGVWSLVAQPLVGNTMLLIMYSLGASWMPRLVFNWAEVKSYIHYSSDVFATNVLDYLNRNADDFIIGKFLGSSPLGYYALSYQIMLYPLQQVSVIIVRVLFPSLSQLQNDIPRFRNMYLKAITTISLITFPMMLGLLSLAEEFIVVVFGPDWIEMLDVLRIFCILGMSQSVATTLGTIYLSTGNTRLMFKLNMASTPFFIIGFLLGLPWGIAGVATSCTVVSIATYLVSIFIAFRIVDMPVSDFFRVLTRTFFVSAGMAAIVTIAKTTWINTAIESPILRLSTGVMLGIALYIVLSLLFNRQQIMDIVNKLLSVARKKKN